MEKGVVPAVVVAVLTGFALVTASCVNADVLEPMARVPGILTLPLLEAIKMGDDVAMKTRLEVVVVPTARLPRL